MPEAKRYFPTSGTRSSRRIASSRASQVIAAAPDVIIGSWCGKPIRPAKISARPGWDRIPAVKSGHIFEVKSTYILQPGPAALTEGVERIHRILSEVIAA